MSNGDWIRVAEHRCTPVLIITTLVRSATTAIICEVVRGGGICRTAVLRPTQRSLSAVIQQSYSMTAWLKTGSLSAIIIGSLFARKDYSSTAVFLRLFVSPSAVRLSLGYRVSRATPYHAHQQSLYGMLHLPLTCVHGTSSASLLVPATAADTFFAQTSQEPDLGSELSFFLRPIYLNNRAGVFPSTSTLLGPLQTVCLIPLVGGACQSRRGGCEV